jgi:hypothetical protein
LAACLYAYVHAYVHTYHGGVLVSVKVVKEPEDADVADEFEEEEGGSDVGHVWDLKRLEETDAVAARRRRRRRTGTGTRR